MNCEVWKQEKPTWTTALVGVNVHVGLLINEPPGGAEMPFV